MSKEIDIQTNVCYDMSVEEMIKKLVEYKEKQKITFSELARELDVPEVYIYRWKSGKPISRANKKILAEFIKSRRL